MKELFHSYRVTSYHPNSDRAVRREGRAYILDIMYVQAATAESAIENAIEIAGGTSVAIHNMTITRVRQNDPNPAVRDNAHFQRDSAGTKGWQAVRAEVEDQFAAI